MTKMFSDKTDLWASKGELVRLVRRVTFFVSDTYDEAEPHTSAYTLVVEGMEYPLDGPDLVELGEALGRILGDDSSKIVKEETPPEDDLVVLPAEGRILDDAPPEGTLFMDRDGDIWKIHDDKVFVADQWGKISNELDYWASGRDLKRDFAEVKRGYGPLTVITAYRG